MCTPTNTLSQSESKPHSYNNQCGFSGCSEMNGKRQVLSKTFHALQEAEWTPLAFVLPYKHLQYHRATKRKHVTQDHLCFSLSLTSSSFYLEIDMLRRKGRGLLWLSNRLEVEGNCLHCLTHPHDCNLLFLCLLLSQSTASLLKQFL